MDQLSHAAYPPAPHIAVRLGSSTVVEVAVQPQIHMPQDTRGKGEVVIIPAVITMINYYDV
jgi:hypothetical protein